MKLLEDYNNILREYEDDTIRRLNTILDRSFNRLIRRTRMQMRAGRDTPGVSRNLQLLQEFRQLVPRIRPDQVDQYDTLFRNLVTFGSNRGIRAASELAEQAGRAKVSVNIPFEAVIAASRDARKYLQRHGEDFAQRASDIVAQGIAEGRPTSNMIEDLRERLGVVKSRGATIVRTENLRAYNSSANTYYNRVGISQVVHYATADDRTCPWCAPRAGKIYKRGDTKVPLHPNCVLGDTPVTTGHIVAATRAIYRGKIVTIRTKSGRKLSVTPQHPVLTDHGWIPAEHLTKGMKLVSNLPRVPGTVLPDLYDMPPTAEQVFEAFSAASPVPAMSVPVTPVDLHGDGISVDGDVEVVFTDRPFQVISDLQPAPQRLVVRGGPTLSPKTSPSTTDQLLVTLTAAANGLVSLTEQLQALLRGESSLTEPQSLTSRAWDDTRLLEPAFDCASTATELLSKCVDAFPGLIQLDETLSIEVAAGHTGPVYDFTTLSSSYSAAGVVSHNCRCYLAPWDEDVMALSPKYAQMPEQHRREVRAQNPDDFRVNLNTPATFEQLIPRPLN